MGRQARYNWPRAPGERVLLEQPFALDDKKTVGQVAKDAGIAISGYLRFELGGKSS